MAINEDKLKLLIEVETIEVRDDDGTFIGIFRELIGLQSDENGKYIVSKETGEKIYFEYHYIPKKKDE